MSLIVVLFNKKLCLSPRGHSTRFIISISHVDYSEIKHLNNNNNQKASKNKTTFQLARMPTVCVSVATTRSLVMTTRCQ